MNNAKAIIEERKNKIAQEKEIIKEKQSANKFFNGVNKFLRGFFGVTGGLLLVGGMPGVGIAFLSTAVANHISLKNRGKEEDAKLKYLDREAEHIENVTKNPINGSREMTAKRINKVRELEARKDKTSSKKKWSKFADTCSNVFQWAALTAAVCVPAVGWVSALSLGAKYLTSKNKVEIADEDNKLALRLNNLNLDLDLTNAQQPSYRAAASTQGDARKKEKANDKVETKTYSREDERLVDEYIASLENTPQKETIKQYTK